MSHSRQRRPLGAFPPEIRQLIEKYGTIDKAQKAAGISAGTFDKFASGKRAFTDEMKRRVRNALVTTKENPMPSPRLEIPQACPPLLADLLRKLGSKTQAKGFLKVGDIMLNKMMNGKAEIPPAMLIKIKADLGVSLISAPEQAAPVPDGPAFVPWDGKTKATLQLSASGKNPSRKIKNVPQPIIDLATRAGSLTGAAKMIGSAIGTVIGLAEGKIAFSDKYQRKVHAAMHGLNPPATSMGEEFDKYSLGIAICLIKGANFDRIADVAEILMAKVVFRKSTGAGWIIIYRMADEDLPKFKKLALRDAQEIVCP